MKSFRFSVALVSLIFGGSRLALAASPNISQIRDKFQGKIRVLRPSVFDSDAYYQDSRAGSPRYTYWGYFLAAPAKVEIQKVSQSGNSLRFSLRPADALTPGGQLLLTWGPELNPSTEDLAALVDTAFELESGTDTFAPFSVNTNSGVIHRSGANHLPDGKYRTPAASLGQTKKCSVCFPPRKRLGPGEPLEYQLARAVYLEDIRNRRLVAEKSVADRLRAAGERVLAQWKYPLTGYEYEFLAVDEPIPNAMAVPTGLIIVTKGMLAMIESDDELDAILAHEIAHVELHHTIQQLRANESRENTAKIVSVALAVGAGVAAGMNSGDVATGANAAVNATFLSVDWISLWLKSANAGYSQNLEFEADLYARELMEKARPVASPEALSRVLSKTISGAALSARAAHWFSNHPAVEDRLTALEKMRFIQEPATAYSLKSKSGKLLAKLVLTPKVTWNHQKNIDVLLGGLLETSLEYLDLHLPDRIDAVKMLDLKPSSGASWNQCLTGQDPIVFRVPGSVQLLFTCRGVPGKMLELPETVDLRHGETRIRLEREK